MKKLTEQQIKVITELLKEGKPLSEEYKEILFPGKREYELIYAGKEREEDIIAETMSAPLQGVKTFGNPKPSGWTNKLIFGDNLQVLKYLYEEQQAGRLEKIRLIYIDPPFATKQEFRGNKEQKAYQDKLAGAKFLEFLRKRLIFLKELLANDGNIYVHLDWKKGHYVKVLIDEVLGEHNFVNEVIWHYESGGVAKNFFPRKHEVIFLYSKEPKLNLYDIGTARNKCELCGQVLEKWNNLKRHIDKDGRVYRTIRSAGKIYKYYDDDIVPPTDVWLAINHLQQKDPERTGFPTQKPEALLERIIKASSKTGDIILDAFAGSGTTAAVAEKLFEDGENRRWIMIDSSKLALYTMQKRLLNLKEEIGNKGKSLTPKPFAVYYAGLYDYKLLKNLPWEEYRDFALKLFQCRQEEHSVSGIKLDGYLGVDHVLVFKWKDKEEYVMDRGYIDDLHKAFGEKIGRQMFIIAPTASVLFFEDYIEKDGTKYFILRIPDSIIEEINKRGFERLKQPIREADINDVVDSVGFDFIIPPEVRCEYKITKSGKGQMALGETPEQAVIKIKSFKSKVLGKETQEMKDLESLSMVMIDYDYNNQVFDIDDYWFAEDIAKNDYEVRFDPKKVGKQMMIIYMDIFGNEKREIKALKDFKE